MKNLYDLDASEVIDDLADEVVEKHRVSKKLAKKLVLNALVYNVVWDEIMGQVRFLMDKWEDE